MCLGEQKSLKHEGLPVRAATCPSLKQQQQQNPLIIKYLPSTSFPIDLFHQVEKKKSIHRLAKGQRVIHKPEGKAGLLQQKHVKSFIH